MPRGNAKSTVSSLCSLYGLNADCFYPPYQPKKRIFSGEPVVLTLAVDKKQAQIVREGAMSIANYSPYVLKFAECKKTYIVNKKRGGRVEACSSDAGNKDGLKPDIVICDEWAAQKTDKALNTMVGGFGKKPQPLLIKITTAGDDCQSKPAKIDYDYSLDILKGVKKDEHYYISIRQADDDVKVNDFKRFGEFTPMLRIGNEYSKTLLKAIKNEYKKAYDSESPNKIREYLIKRLNRWQQDSEEKFLDTEALEKIKKCMIDPKEFDELIRGENYVGGYDMSIKVDLTARALWYKLPDGRYALDTKGFIPADSIDRHEHTDLIPYRYWIQQGYVDSIRGMVIDTNDVMEELMDYEIRNHVFGLEIVYDAAWATQFAADMSAGRNSRSQTYTMIECPQTTTRLNEPTNKFEELLMAGKIVIKRNDCFLWCCENAYIQYDNGGRRKIAKKSQKSPKRIDLLAAAIFGLVRVSTLEQGNLQHELETGTFTF